MALVGAVLCLWMGGFLQFANSLPNRVEDPDGATDAIVVLTGGAERLDAGLDLLIAGKGKRLLVSGVDRATTVAALQKRSPRAPEMFACCVELGHEAEDTMGNAIEAALWMQQANFRSLRLVTANYHMPRSLLLFRDFMADARVVANPVFPERVKTAEWWQFPGTARLLASEFNKYLISLLTVRIAARPDSDTVG